MGVRLKKNILETHNSKPKVRVIKDSAEIKYDFQLGISIITTTMRIDYIDNVFNNYLRQNYKNKELIIVLHNNKLDINTFKEKAKGYKNIKVFQCDENVNFGECKNFAFSKTRFNYIALFDDDDFYAPNYLIKSMLPFSYTDCDIVGKRTCFMYFEDKGTLGIFVKNNENMFVKNAYVMDSSMIIKRQILQKIKFPITPHPAQVLTKFQDICSDNSIKIYSTDRFNYVVHRRNPTTHTWDITYEKILKWCDVVATNVEDYTKYVIS